MSLWPQHPGCQPDRVTGFGATFPGCALTAASRHVPHSLPQSEVRCSRPSLPACVTAVAFSTAVTAVLASGLVGYFGNLPFGLAPGMGLNAYFTYGVCVAKGIPPGVALASVFLTGLSFALLSAIGACSYIQRVMPTNLKHATTVGIGLFQAFIGFRMVNLVVADSETLVALGDLRSPEVALSLATTFLIGILVVHRVQGAMLIGIGISSCFSWAAGLSPLPDRFVEMPSVTRYTRTGLARESSLRRTCP